MLYFSAAQIYVQGLLPPTVTALTRFNPGMNSVYPRVAKGQQHPILTIAQPQITTASHPFPPVFREPLGK